MRIDNIKDFIMEHLQYFLIGYVFTFCLCLGYFVYIRSWMVIVSICLFAIGNLLFMWVVYDFQERNQALLDFARAVEGDIDSRKYTEQYVCYHATESIFKSIREEMRRVKSQTVTPKNIADLEYFLKIAIALHILHAEKLLSDEDFLHELLGIVPEYCEYDFGYEDMQKYDQDSWRQQDRADDTKNVDQALQVPGGIMVRDDAITKLQAINFRAVVVIVIPDAATLKVEFLTVLSTEEIQGHAASIMLDAENLQNTMQSESSQDDNIEYEVGDVDAFKQ